MDFRHGTIRTAIGLALASPMAVFAQNQPVPAPVSGGETLAHYQQHGEQRLMAADTDGDGRSSAPSSSPPRQDTAIRRRASRDWTRTATG